MASLALLSHEACNRFQAAAAPDEGEAGLHEELGRDGGGPGGEAEVEEEEEAAEESEPDNQPELQGDVVRPHHPSSAAANNTGVLRFC